MADSEKAPGILANILAVAGFIILIVIIVWGAYHLLRLTGTGVSSLFSRFTGSSQAITINAPQAPVQSGASFPLSWTYSSEGAGNYAFLYQCKAGFRFDVASPSGAKQAIPCGNAFNVGENKSLTLTPILSGTTSVDVPFTVAFVSNATSTGERPQGTGTLRVVAATSGTGTQTPSSTSAPSISSTPAGGMPDLSVRILSVGVIDEWGNFVARAPMHAGEISAVRFDIANNGSASSGSWAFTVDLPMQGTYRYASPAQMSLAPGSHIENILRFRPVQNGGGTLTVNVDSNGAVSESNEGNNAVSIHVNAGNFPYQYVQPYVY